MFRPLAGVNIRKNIGEGLRAWIITPALAPAIGVLLARHPRRERQVPGQGLIHVVEIGRTCTRYRPRRRSPCMCQHYKSRFPPFRIADIHIRPSRRHPTNDKRHGCAVRQAFRWCR